MTFRVGDTVKVAVRAHAGHHRTPDYLKGRRGTISRVHGSFRTLRRGPTEAMESHGCVSTSSSSRRASSGRMVRDPRSPVRGPVRALAGAGAVSGHGPARYGTIRSTVPTSPPPRHAFALSRISSSRRASSPARTCERASTGSCHAHLPTAHASSRAHGSTRTSSDAFSTTRALPPSSSGSTRERRHRSSRWRTPRTSTTWWCARSAPVTRRRCWVLRPTGTRASPTDRVRSRIREESSASSACLADGRRAPRRRLDREHPLPRAPAAARPDGLVRRRGPRRPCHARRDGRRRAAGDAGLKRLPDAQTGRRTTSMAVPRPGPERSVSSPSIAVARRRMFSIP